MRSINQPRRRLRSKGFRRSLVVASFHFSPRRNLERSGSKKGRGRKKGASKKASRGKGKAKKAAVADEEEDEAEPAATEEDDSEGGVRFRRLQIDCIGRGVAIPV